jgi:hypothetical protein
MVKIETRRILKNLSSSLFFVKIYTTNGFLKSDCFLLLVIPGLTTVSLLERKSGFEDVTQLSDRGKRRSSSNQAYSLWFLLGSTMEGRSLVGSTVIPVKDSLMQVDSTDTHRGYEYDIFWEVFQVGAGIATGKQGG